MSFRPLTLALSALALCACSTTPRSAPLWNPPAPPAAWTAATLDLRTLPPGKPSSQTQAWDAVLGPGGWAQAFNDARRRLACVDLWYAARLWERPDAGDCPAWPGRPGAPEIPERKLWSPSWR